MPMIGGELAGWASPAGCRVGDDGGVRDLGWVTDWLYGSASLPPAPLPAPDPPYHAITHGEAGRHSSTRRTIPSRHAAARRRTRQLALF